MTKPTSNQQPSAQAIGETVFGILWPLLTPQLDSDKVKEAADPEVQQIFIAAWRQAGARLAEKYTIPELWALDPMTWVRTASAILEESQAAA